MNQEDLLGEMPLDLLTQALDDDGDGLADAAAWASVCASAEERLRNAFGGDVPMDLSQLQQQQFDQAKERLERLIAKYLSTHL